jgi:pimeloyl-ACP methyl ester carboxylesterase
MAFLHQFERTTFHVVGHSMGGYLAQMAMCRFPEKFGSVTSISAGPAVSPEMKSKLNISNAVAKTWEILVRNQPTGDFEADLPAWLETWRFLNAQRPFDTDMATRYTRCLYQGHPRNARVAVNHVQAMTTVPDSLVDELPKVRCPFLVIHGTSDPLVPLDNGEASARLVYQSDIVRLEGAGHMFFDPDTWQEILNHLISHTSAYN